MFSRLTPRRWSTTSDVSTTAPFSLPVPLNDADPESGSGEEETPSTWPEPQKLVPGETLERIEIHPFTIDYKTIDEQTTANSWSPIDASSLLVRVGPDYVRGSGQKEPSQPFMYDVVLGDAFHSPQTVADMTRFFDSDAIVDRCPERLPVLVPYFFAINFVTPTGAPAVFGASPRDGQSFQAVWWMRMTDETYDAVCAYEDGKITAEDLSPALRLWMRFIQEVQVDPEWFGRFKAIPRCINTEALGEGMIRNLFEGMVRPWLMGPSGSNLKIHGERSLGILEFNYHAILPKIVRYVTSQTIDKWKYGMIDLGFTIEGRENDELPEQLLWGWRINKLDPSVLTEFPVAEEEYPAGASRFALPDFARGV